MLPEPELAFVQLVITSAGIDELVVRSTLDNLAALEHQNLVGALHGRQAVGNDERRATPPEHLQRILDERVVFVVEMGRSLVEDEDLGSANNARAMATRCRWPPDNLTPRSPMVVSYPFWKLLTNSSQWARRPASRMAARSAAADP